MTKHLIIAGVALGLAACGTDKERAAEAARHELAIVERSAPGIDDLCQAHRKVAEAELEAGHAADYRTARLRADAYCGG
jgi:hypothetical protein